MEYGSLYRQTVVELRRIARENRVRLPAGVNKADIISRILEAVNARAEHAPEKPAERAEIANNIGAGEVIVAKKQEVTPPPSKKEKEAPCAVARPAEPGESRAAQIGKLQAPFLDGGGILELQADGYGFLRAENCSQGKRDIYISGAQIRRFCLKSGDHVVGKTRPQREGDRYNAMVYIDRVNGRAPGEMIGRRAFESLVPVHPDEKFRMERPGGGSDLALRLIDFLAPIGKGQRGLIVSPPKSGKTTLIRKIANAVSDNHPDVHLIVLLVDERPEEVTDMRRSVRGEVIDSTFDRAPENHVRISETVLARAERLVEAGKDVVLLLDSITRLARAYNLVIPPTGRSLSGGLDPGALMKPKRFFGAARNIENGGSLTVIATALVETGSRMDDIIYEEFKGTGNMELHLDRKLSEKRVFPAIDILKSGTRRDELLLSGEELTAARQVRRILAGGGARDNTEDVIAMLEKTATNAEFFGRIGGWMQIMEKDGYK